MRNLRNNKGIGLLALILIIVAILVIGGIIVGVVIINKNVNKEPMTAKEFTDIMEDKGFQIVDVKQQFSNYDYIEKAYVALEEDGDYQIEFYKLAEEEDAIYFYNLNKDKFESTKTSISTELTKSIGNNSKYVLTSDGKYKVISRIEDTAIYLDVDEKYKDKIKQILKELGY